MTKVIFELFEFQIYSPVNDKSETFYLAGVEIMFISSIFCSSDIIAAITIVKFDE